MRSVNSSGCTVKSSLMAARIRSRLPTIIPASADAQADVLAEAGYDALMRSHQRVVMGHEFCGEVLENGPGATGALTPGTSVVAMPLVRKGPDIHPIGLSEEAPGAYAEQVVVQGALTFALPNGLSPDVGVLTEPMAIGWHAVQRSEVKKRDVAIVIGCGPVGLAIVAMLKARGVNTIVASDFSAHRRELARPAEPRSSSTQAPTLPSRPPATRAGRPPSRTSSSSGWARPRSCGASPYPGTTSGGRRTRSAPPTPSGPSSSSASEFPA